MGKTTSRYRWRTCPVAVETVPDRFCPVEQFHELWHQGKQDPVSLGRLAVKNARFWVWMLTRSTRFRSESVLYVGLLRLIGRTPEQSQARIQAWLASFGSLEAVESLLVEGMILLRRRLSTAITQTPRMLQYSVQVNFRFWVKDQIRSHYLKAATVKKKQPALRAVQLPSQEPGPLQMAVGRLTVQNRYILERHICDIPISLPDEQQLRSNLCLLLEKKLSEP